MSSPSPSPSRRGLVLGGAALGVIGWVTAHACGHRPMAGRTSPFLGSAGLGTLTAAAEALLPQGADASGLALDVDAFLADGDPVTAGKLRAALAVLEHTGGAGPLSFRRFSRLPSDHRALVIEDWLDSGIGLRRQIAAAVRKTVFFTWYAGPRGWEHIGYDGPWVNR